MNIIKMYTVCGNLNMLAIKTIRRTYLMPLEKFVSENVFSYNSTIYKNRFYF